jgi:hypothetical protein
MKRAMRIASVIASAAVALLLSVLFTGPSAQASGTAGTAAVSVIHGIPGTPVNVFVNGKSTLSDFKPGTVAGPLDLPAGSYRITVFAASNKKGTGTPVITARASVAAGKNYSLVAHLTESGRPTITPYVNDTSPVAAGKARLVVRHDAAAPTVDVRANGEIAFAGLSNPDQAGADLAAGSIKADVVLAGTDTIAIGPADLALREGTATIVYAVGSAEDKTLGLVTQTIRGLHSAPSGIPAGSGGLLDAGPGTAGWVWTASVVGMLTMLAGGAGLVRVRQNAR